LAKASIPLIFLPLVAIGTAIVTHILMLLVSSLILTVSGQGVGTMWAHLSVFRMWMLMSYHILTNHALWPFPVYCYLLLVSAWARRAPLLWAALPILAITGVEKLITHTSHFLMLLGSRLIGDAPTIIHAPDDMFPTNPMTHITVGPFLSSPGLWLGLLVSAIFLAVAIQVRRYQGPN
jgi:ABC-2 type transport system permease protein